MPTNDITRAIEYLEEAVVTARPLRILFEIVEGEGLPAVDLTITQEGEHVFSDCNFENFEEALIAAGINLWAAKGE